MMTTLLKDAPLIEAKFKEPDAADLNTTTLPLTVLFFLPNEKLRLSPDIASSALQEFRTSRSLTITEA
jgi:hypothetical protein